MPCPLNLTDTAVQLTTGKIGSLVSGQRTALIIFIVIAILGFAFGKSAKSPAAKLISFLVAMGASAGAISYFIKFMDFLQCYTPSA